MNDMQQRSAINSIFRRENFSPSRECSIENDRKAIIHRKLSVRLKPRPRFEHINGGMLENGNCNKPKRRKKEREEERGKQTSEQ